MKSIHELKNEKQSKMDALMKACRVFFAFSDQQFDEGKTPLQEGEKYVRLMAGGFIPRNSVKDFTEGIKAIEKWYKDAVKENKMRKENIIYELSNHESWYTYDLEPALQALGEDYTREEVSKVFNDEREKQIV